MIQQLTDVAKKLRQQSTEAEKRLWNRLRSKKSGFKFRRQQQIGNYIVDFMCFEKRLVVELDGGQHAIDTEYDTHRDSWLRSEGFDVVRFWNTDVFENIEGVMEAIMNRLSAPSLGPSRKGREGKKSPSRKGREGKRSPSREGREDRSTPTRGMGRS